MSRKLVGSGLLAVTLYLVGIAACNAVEPPVRAPAVQGQFYPADRDQLKLAVEKYLAGAPASPSEKPVAIVAPHAGYIYSGQICADAFRRAQGHAYDLVVILGTNHTVPSFRGVALYPSGAFRTPLGEVAIDEETVKQLALAANCSLDRTPHVREHSIEVQVPFVQYLFPKAKIVAAVVGSPDLQLCTGFGQALAKALEKRSALIVASSDLSHYPAYDDACRTDRRTLEAMVTLDPAALRSAVKTDETSEVPELSTCACGEAPVLAAMAAAKALGATHGAVVSYANSGDTLIGDHGRVVGYGAVAFYTGPGKNDLDGLKKREEPSPGATLRPEDRKALLAFARETIERILTTQTAPLPRGFDARAYLKRGGFVTLKKKGELRGCIGHMAEDTPLAYVVGTMAIQAAFKDRRFTPVRIEEMPDIEVEISVLTPAKPVAGVEEIVLGRDGVILSKGGRSAVFLPQVATEQGWSREQMLDQLSRKAGLPEGSWKEGAKFSTFQAEVFHESEFKK